MYSQIQSYMNANHLKLYLLKLFYSLIYIFEVFIFSFLSLACCNVISMRTNPLHLFVCFLPHHTACGTSPNRGGTCFPASDAQCFNHWDAREVQAPSYQSRASAQNNTYITEHQHTSNEGPCALILEPEQRNPF